MPKPPDASLLRAKTTGSFYDLGQLYQSNTDSVSPVDGSVGNAITTNIFHDLPGDTIATYTGRSGAIKATFDGAGRETATFATDEQPSGVNAALWGQRHTLDIRVMCVALTHSSRPA